MVNRQVFEQIDLMIDRFKELPYQSMDKTIRENFKNAETEIIRSKKEFESKLFLILAFGPVKSGKSTLINLLAGEEEVSPTEFGVECTVRPSILVKAKNEPKIRRFFSKEFGADNQKQKEHFNYVLDLLRGISTEEEISQYIEIEEHPYNLLNIQKFVTSNGNGLEDLNKEPLIIVIEVEAKDSKIINETTAIIDVPGLDGVSSNWRGKPIHNWVLTRSDFLLFVQSSMAALNIDTNDFLSEVYAKSKEPPLNLIQNIIEAKHWRGKKSLDNEAKKQKEKALEQIKKILPNVEKNDFKSSHVNLGKAYDYKFNDYRGEEDVLTKSGFSSLEDGLVTMLEQRRSKIHLDNSSKYLKNSLLLIDKRLNENVSLINNKLSEVNRLSSLINERLDKSSSIFSIDRLISSLLKDWNGNLYPTATEMKQKFDSLVTNLYVADNLTWYEYKRLIENKKQEMLVEFIKDTLGRDSRIIYSLIGQMNDYFKSEIVKCYSDEKNNLNGLLEEIGAESRLNVEGLSALIKYDDISRDLPKTIELHFKPTKEKSKKSNAKKDNFLYRTFSPTKSLSGDKEQLKQQMEVYLNGSFKSIFEKVLQNSIHSALDRLKKELGMITKELEEINNEAAKEYSIVIKNAQDLKAQILKIQKELELAS